MHTIVLMEVGTKISPLSFVLLKTFNIFVSKTMQNNKIMQVFIVGTPLKTAMALDPRRLNKQIIECQQILEALNGAKAWSNHPCVLQYRESVLWLRNYMKCLDSYQKGDMISAELFSGACDCIRPSFHTGEYFKQMKRRLYSKDPSHYAQWANLGESEDNWYWSQKENNFIKYRNGKRID